MVTIFGKEKEDVTKDVAKDVTKDVTKGNRTEVIIEMIGKKPGITINEIAGLLNLTRRTVLRELKHLKTQKRIFLANCSMTFFHFHLVPFVF